jgi:hypothetical protein
VLAKVLGPDKGRAKVPRVKKPPDKRMASLEAEMKGTLREVLEVARTGADVGSRTVDVNCGLQSANVGTMYKRKDRKVNPVDTPLPNGINPGGGVL